MEIQIKSNHKEKQLTHCTLSNDTKKQDTIKVCVVSGFGVEMKMNCVEINKQELKLATLAL